MQRGRVSNLVGIWSDREREAGRISKEKAHPGRVSDARRSILDIPQFSRPVFKNVISTAPSLRHPIEPISPFSQPAPNDVPEHLIESSSKDKEKQFSPCRLPIASTLPPARHSSRKSKTFAQPATHSLHLPMIPRPKRPCLPTDIRRATPAKTCATRTRPNLSPEIIERRANRPMIKRACGHYEPIATITVPPTSDSLRQLDRMPRGEYMLARLGSDPPAFIAADSFAKDGQLAVLCGACRRGQQEERRDGAPIADEQFVLIVSGRSEDSTYPASEASVDTVTVEAHRVLSPTSRHRMFPDTARMRIRGARGRRKRSSEYDTTHRPVLRSPTDEDNRLRSRREQPVGRATRPTTSNLEKRDDHFEVKSSVAEGTQLLDTQSVITDHIIEQLEAILSEHTKTLTSIFGEVRHARDQSQEAWDLSMRLSSSRQLHRPAIEMTDPFADFDLIKVHCPGFDHGPDVELSPPHLDDPPQLLRRRTASVSGIMSLLDNSASAVGAQTLHPVASQHIIEPRQPERWAQLATSASDLKSPHSGCSSWASTKTDCRSVESGNVQSLPGSFVESDTNGPDRSLFTPSRGQRQSRKIAEPSCVSKLPKRQKTIRSSLNSEYFPPIPRDDPMDTKPLHVPFTPSCSSETQALTQQPIITYDDREPASQPTNSPPRHPISSRIRNLASKFSDSTHGLPFSDARETATPNYLHHDPARRPLPMRGVGDARIQA